MRHGIRYFYGMHVRAVFDRESIREVIGCPGFRLAQLSRKIKESDLVDELFDFVATLRFAFLGVNRLCLVQSWSGKESAADFKRN